jgi:hypothetical protein
VEPLPALPDAAYQEFGPPAGDCPVDLFGEDFALRDFEARFREPMLFIDIETAGLGDAVVFLAGVLRYDGGRRAAGAPPFRFSSCLAADPSFEPGLMGRVAGLLAEADRWVSFNGKSFDLPRLRRRACRHGLALPACRVHVDLLHEVRRRWKGRLPDCKLSTVERRLLGLERGPWEIPGREVPDRYWDFVTGGERRLLDPVVEHNRRDVLAMAALLARLGGEGLEI